MADDTIRALTAAEVRELMEWADAEFVTWARIDSSYADGAIRGINDALAKLCEIAVRPVLEWVDIPGQQAAQAGLYFVGLGADGLWRAAWDRRMVGDAYDTLEAAKAACEEHARGQG